MRKSIVIGSLCALLIGSNIVTYCLTKKKRSRVVMLSKEAENAAAKRRELAEGYIKEWRANPGVRPDLLKAKYKGLQLIDLIVYVDERVEQME